MEVNDAAGCVSMAYGDTLNASIDAALQTDCYQFTGSAGDHIRIRLLETSGDLVALTEVLHADGSVLSGCLQSAATQRDCTLDTGGTYTLLVSDNYVYGTGTGDYNLILSLLTPDNDAPIAVDDAVTTDENVAVTITVADDNGSGADFDPDGNLDPTSVTLGDGVNGLKQADNGQLVNNGDGSVTYTPYPGFTGIDTFEYQICDTGQDGDGSTDGDDLCDTATVTVTVNGPIGNPPDAVDDAVATGEDTPITIDVLANDSDAEDDPLSITDVTQGTHGAVVNNGTDVTYTPNADYFGSDTFTYTISDGNGGSDFATVMVTINAVPDDPVANDDTATTNEDTPVNIDVLANDFYPDDGDNSNLSVSTITQGSSGTVTNNGTDVTYTPNTGFIGQDSFTYTVTDETARTASGMVTVTVGGTCTPLTFGNQPVAGSIAAANEEDCYQFAGVAGDRIRVRVVEMSGTLSPAYEVLILAKPPLFV